MSEQKYCTTHKVGGFQEHSIAYKEHHTNDCIWVDYDPEKHIPDYADYEVEEHQDEKKNSTERIYEFAKSKICKLVISKNDSHQIFAIVQIKDHYETIDLNGKDAKNWLRWLVYREHKQIHPVQIYERALLQLSSEAKYNEAEIQEIYNQIAMIGDTIYYDMGGNDWKFVKISPHGIDTVEYNERMPVFVRKQSQSQQVEHNSKFGNPLGDLTKLLKIKPDDIQVFQVHTVAMFLEKSSVPIMALTGEQGSIKSTIGKTIKRIVDPSGIESSSFPEKDNLQLHLANRYITNFDNVSRYDRKIADVLCRAITGEGYPKRKHYEDTEEVILKYKRKIILNGISPSLEFSDLRERTIRYELTKISEDQRITDEEYEDKFNSLRPLLLGQIFAVLQKVLATAPKIKQEIKRSPRMADFGQYGEAISRALGYEEMSFLAKYDKKLDEHSLEYFDDYPILSLVRELMQEKDDYEDTVSNFFDKIRKIATEKEIDISSTYIRFPKTANKITPHIKQIMSDFRQQGFEIHTKPYNLRDGKHPRGCQVIYIHKTQKRQESLSSLSSLPELVTKPQNETNVPVSSPPSHLDSNVEPVHDRDGRHDRGMEEI